MTRAGGLVGRPWPFTGATAASWLAIAGLLLWLGLATGAKRSQVPPPDGQWTADAVLSVPSHH